MSGHWDEYWAGGVEGNKSLDTSMGTGLGVWLGLGGESVKAWALLGSCDLLLWLQIEQQVSQCTCEKRFQVTRVAEGQYRVSA